MGKKSLISVIVPVYNTEKFLHRCVDSILNQTYKNIEIILIDDGSTDASGSICDEYAKIDSRIKVIHKENEGVSRARNLALEIAKGEYIGFVDSDDSIEPDMYEILYDNILHYGAEISLCNQKRINGNFAENESSIDKITVFNRNEAIKELSLERAFSGGLCNKMIKKSVLDKVRFAEDIYFAEDKLFLMQFLLICNKVVFDPAPKYNYFIRENSACTSTFSEKTFTFFEAHKRIFYLLAETGEAELIEYAHTTILLSNAILLCIMSGDKAAQKKFGKMIKKSMRANFSLSRLKFLSTVYKIGVIVSIINPKIFFGLYPFYKKQKYLEGEQ